MGLPFAPERHQMSKIYEHGGVMVSDEGPRTSRLASIGLGFYSGLVFAPTRVHEHLSPAVIAFLGATGFLFMACIFAILNTFGVIISGLAGDVSLSDKPTVRTDS